MSEQHINPVAAVVVGFFPSFPVLDALLLSLLGQVGLVIFVDNGGGAGYLASRPTEKGRVQYVDLGGNEGLGYALNEGFKIAVRCGFDFVATFDQDSSPPAMMIAGLLEAHRGLLGKGIACAAIGPRFYDSREGKKHQFPLYKQVGRGITAVPQMDDATGLFDVDVLITSGMLVNTAVWKAGVTYNPGLFVDYTDTDWCFRAREAGFRLFVSPDQEMGHALSDAPPIRLFGLNFLRYSPVRRYYYFRNTIFFIRQSYVSWAWKGRLLIGLGVRLMSNVFIDKQKLAGLKMTLLGAFHGIRGKLGAYKPH
jgi:rhamnosyltransferase